MKAALEEMLRSGLWTRAPSTRSAPSSVGTPFSVPGSPTPMLGPPSLLAHLLLLGRLFWFGNSTTNLLHRDRFNWAMRPHPATCSH